MESFLLCKMPECGQKVKKHALKSHATTHHPTKRFRCSICNYRERLKKNVEMHQDNRHNGQGEVIDEKNDEYLEILETIMEQCFPYGTTESEEESDVEESDEEESLSKTVNNKDLLVFLEPAPSTVMLRQKNAFTCQMPACGQKISPGKSMFGFQAHALVHHPNKRFRCTVCDFEAHQKGGILRHQEVMHEGGGLIVDEIDETYFETLDELIAKCFPTARQFKTRKVTGRVTENDVKAVVKMAQDDSLLASTSTSDKNAKISDREVKEGDLACQIPGCEQVLKKGKTGMKYLRVHARVHHPIKRFHCSMCNQASMTKLNVVHHQKRKHNNLGSIVDIADKNYFDILSSITKKCFPEYVGRNVARKRTKREEIENSRESIKKDDESEDFEGETFAFEDFDVSKNEPDPVDIAEEDHLCMQIDTKVKEEIFKEEEKDEDALNVDLLLEQSAAMRSVSQIQQVRVKLESIDQKEAIPVLLLTPKGELLSQDERLQDR